MIADMKCLVPFGEMCYRTDCRDEKVLVMTADMKCLVVVESRELLRLKIRFDMNILVLLGDVIVRIAGMKNSNAWWVILLSGRSQISWVNLAHLRGCGHFQACWF